MTYKIVALDLDGTLLNSQHIIRSDTVDALEQVRERGLKIVIVTGRHHVAAHAYHDQLKLDTPIICCNGAYVFNYDKSEAIAATPLEPEKALRLLEISRTYKVHNFVYLKDAMTFETEDEHVRNLLAWSHTLPERVRPVIRHLRNFEEEIEQGPTIWKIVVSHPDPSVLSACISHMKEAVCASYEWSWHNLVDIVRAGNSKGARLAEWTRSQGVDLAQVVAIGDNDNDISMLSQAGLGIAMGNATAGAKAAAGFVTGGNDGDGIASALRRFVLER